MTGTLWPASSTFVSHSLSIAAFTNLWTVSPATTFCAWYGPNTLALTAAETSALTWLTMNTYAVCRSDRPTIAHTTPNRGPMCADTSGTSMPLLFLSSSENSRSTCAPSPSGTADRNDRSQMLSSARPWAVLARRPTVQMMAASSWSSNEASNEGFLCAARTNDSVVDANEAMDNGRKVEKLALRPLCVR